MGSPAKPIFTSPVKKKGSSLLPSVQKQKTNVSGISGATNDNIMILNMQSKSEYPLMNKGSMGTLHKQKTLSSSNMQNMSA
mmetsp:Transcript_10356/g.15920  ORF Transcript_10356/g.15920 Transcript_10356/m.15920 type:complete len:81 (+) Transcript_10356:906-1148(+)